MAEIRTCGGKEEFSELTAVVKLMSTLPEEFDPLIASFGEINTQSILTLGTLTGSILDYKLKQKDGKLSVDSSKANNKSIAFSADKRYKLKEGQKSAN